MKIKAKDGLKIPLPENPRRFLSGELNVPAGSKWESYWIRCLKRGEVETVADKPVKKDGDK